MAATGWRRGSTAGIPPDISARQHQAIEDMRISRLEPATLDALIADIDALPPQLAQPFTRLSFYSFRYPLPREPKPGFLTRLMSGRADAPAAPVPGIPLGRLAWLRLGHPDGFVREQALRSLDDAPASAFRLALLLLRADDWVPQVATAGLAALRRLAPHVPRDAIRAIAPHVAAHYLRQLGKMDIVAPVAEMLMRDADWPDMLDWLRTGRDATVLPALRVALLSERIDPALPDLLRARHYLVRARAARTLLSGRAEIVAGRTTKTDVSYSGRRTRSVPNVIERPITIAADPQEILKIAAQDRTATVRKIAADGLIAHRERLSDPEGLMALFTGEPSAAIRERIDFVRRRLSAP